MQKFIKEYLPYLAIILLVIIIRMFVITPVKVNGASKKIYSAWSKTKRSGKVK